MAVGGEVHLDCGSAASRAVRLCLTGLFLQTFREAKPREELKHVARERLSLSARKAAKPRACDEA